MVLYKELLSLLVAWSLWLSSDGAALRGSARPQRAGARTSRQETPYFWMCPEVICSPVPRSCSFIEYIVFQYDYEVRGRVVNVRCESCEYCLDGPSPNTAARHRRSTNGLRTAQEQATSCPVDIECPSLPDGCEDERLTDVLVGNVVCKRCPACYDNTLINRGEELVR